MFFQRVGIQRALKGLHGEADRQRLQAELTACKTEAPAQARLCLRAQLRGFLDDWPGFLSGNVAEARPLLDLVLADRIGFTPTADRGYQLTVPVVFDRVLTAAVPDLRGLQDRAQKSGVERHFLTVPARIQTSVYARNAV